MEEVNSEKFKAMIYAHLSEYKRSILKITKNGEYKGKEYSHILPKEQIESNFLKGVNIYRKIKLHRCAHHLNSSQVMCINFFQPLTGTKKGEALLLNILEKVGVVRLPPNAKIKEASFEEVLCTEEKTNFDFYVKLVTGEQIFFEIKYTENGFGKIYPNKNNPNKCQDKWKNVYENHISKSLLIKDISSSNFYANYQIWRNISYIRNKDNFVVFLFPFENIKALKEIQSTVANLCNITENIKIINWDIITEIAIELSRDTVYYEHFNLFKDKYLAFNKQYKNVDGIPI